MQVLGGLMVDKALEANREKLEQKKCSDSCGCSKETDTKEDKKIEQKDSVKNEPNPTCFGDWQINCRTIDF